MNATNKTGLTKKVASLDEVIDTLYDIRCDVVHEGNYWGFNFATEGEGFPLILSGRNAKRILRVRISYADFRDIVVRGIIKAVQDII